MKYFNRHFTEEEIKIVNNQEKSLKYINNQGHTDCNQNEKTISHVASQQNEKVSDNIMC